MQVQTENTALLFNCRTKLCQLLCLKYWGSTDLENAVGFETLNRSPLSDHEIRFWMLMSSSILRQTETRVRCLVAMSCFEVRTCTAYLQMRPECAQCPPRSRCCWVAAGSLHLVFLHWIDQPSSRDETSMPIHYLLMSCCRHCFEWFVAFLRWVEIQLWFLQCFCVDVYVERERESWKNKSIDGTVVEMLVGISNVGKKYKKIAWWIFSRA